MKRLIGEKFRKTKREEYVIVFCFFAISPFFFHLLENQTETKEKINKFRENNHFGGNIVRYGWKVKRNSKMITHSLLAEASSFVACTAAVLLCESATVTGSAIFLFFLPLIFR